MKAIPASSASGFRWHISQDEIAVTVLKAEKSLSYLVGMQPAAGEPDLGQRMRELQQSLDGASEAAMITNPYGIIEYVNSAFAPDRVSRS